MLVVSDTSCLSNLYQIKQLNLLHQLFAKIFIPPAVYKELSHFHSDDLFNELEKYGIKMHTVGNNKLTEEILLTGIDSGEAEAIALSIELKPSLLLIDEKHGKQIAKKHGIDTIGILGVILFAKEEGVIAKAKPLYNDLRTKTRFYFSETLYQFFLNKAGEL
jgi:uncharacterized protein